MASPLQAPSARQTSAKPKTCAETKAIVVPRMLSVVLRHRHDATLGVTWETLTIAAETLFGPAKKLRVDRCERALAAYDEPELSDMLADALHWCQANGTSFDDALRLARQHFDAETDSE